MLKNKKLIITIFTVIFVLLIAIIIFIIVMNSRNKQKNVIQEEQINEEELKIDFNSIFNNEETDFIKTAYIVEDEQVGKYNIKAHIPMLTITNEQATNINTEIYNLLVEGILREALNAQQYITYKIDYKSYINNNILSLIIKCNVKQGNNPMRVIVKTYNYDIENNKELKLLDVINEEQKDDLQKKIKEEIETKNKKAELVIKQGYSDYIRDVNSDIYKIENANEFFIGNDNILYLVYAYGNNYYTDEIDLIINKL